MSVQDEQRVVDAHRQTEHQPECRRDGHHFHERRGGHGQQHTHADERAQHDEQDHGGHHEADDLHDAHQVRFLGRELRPDEELHTVDVGFGEREGEFLPSTVARMTHAPISPRTMDAVPFDALRATREFDDARAWLEEARHGPMAPIAAEVWALDHEHRHVLLVRHRRRGWVPPGGKVDFGETPIEAAARELLEETGVAGDLDPVPAAVSVRSYRSDWDPSLGLSYVATIGRELPLAGEDGQPAAWIPLEQEWETVFAEDRDRIREHVRWSASQIGSRPRWPVGSVGSRGRVGRSVRI